MDDEANTISERIVTKNSAFRFFNPCLGTLINRRIQKHLPLLLPLVSAPIKSFYFNWIIGATNECFNFIFIIFCVLF